MSIPHLDKAANGFFYAFWTDGRRSKRKSMGTKDQSVAKARFAQWLLIDGQVQAADASAGYVVGDLWQVYEKERVGQQASPAGVFAWKNLEPHFGHLSPDGVPDAVPAYTAARRAAGRKSGRAISDATIRRELATLRAMLNWCADGRNRRALIAPVGAFKMPPDSEPRDRVLADYEVNRLLASSDDPRVTMFMRLALETAARKSALLELTWDRVDLETRVIHLEVPGRQRTKKRRASVPISATLLPHLEGGGRGPVLGHGGDVYQQIVRIAARAGVPGATPNVFRHTAATNMARRGVPLWKIAKILGNSLAIVEKVYAKHAPDDLREAVDTISGGK